MRHNSSPILLLVQTSLTVLACILLFSRPLGAAGHTGRVALVIGNGSYQHATRLDNPVNDADDMAKALKSFGFQVIKKTDTHLSTLKKAIKTFGRKLNNSEMGFFYYAGHGIQIYGVNYLIPVDAACESPADVEFEAVKADWVLAQMQQAGSKLNIVILDACRDNPFRSFRSGEKGLAPIHAPKGTIVAFATAPGSKAEDGSGRNGTYTAHLLKHLQNHTLTVQDIFRETGLSVMADTDERQIPWISSTPLPRFYLAAVTTIVEGSQAPAASRSSFGSLRVSTQPSGARISVNNSFKGKSPLDIGDISPGMHQVQASLDGYESQTKKVQINKGRKAMLTLYLDLLKTSARLHVTPKPIDARVRIMNIPDKYHSGMELDSGRYDVEVSQAGYITKHQWVELGRGDDIDLYVELTPVIQQETGVYTSTTNTPGQVWKDSVSGMKFVWVPKGCFQMGQTIAEKQYLIKARGKEKYTKYYERELPRHKVCLDGFWMGQHEVTRGEFRQFIKATGYQTDAEKKGTAWIFNKETDWKWKEEKGYHWQKAGYPQNDTHPVVNVSWNDAQAFLKWLNKNTGKEFALPSEAQWEYACRGGSSAMRFWGDGEAEACRYANIADKDHWSPSFPCSDGYKFTAPVGNYKPNDFGLYDMLGNVWEWCQDIYAKDAYKKHSVKNPIYAQSGSNRVFRGGSWCSNPASVRCANRDRNTSDDRNSSLGFRLLRTN